MASRDDKTRPEGFAIRKPIPIENLNTLSEVRKTCSGKELVLRLKSEIMLETGTLCHWMISAVFNGEFFGPRLLMQLYLQSSD